MSEQIQSTIQAEVPEINNPPDLDGELSASLDKHFSQEEQNEVKSNEQKQEKVESKSDAPKPDGQTRVNQESISENPKKDVTQSNEKLLGAEEADAINQRDKGAWGILKNNYKRSLETIKKTTEEKDSEITKLKASLAEKESVRQKEIQSLKTEKEELSKYRAMVDIQSDPEFVSKFDQPIQNTVSSIKNILLSLNVDQNTVDQIDYSNTKLMDEIIGHVSQHRDNFVAKKLRQKVEDLIDLTDKRSETLNDQKKNYKELLETKKRESFSKGAEEEGRSVKHLENIASSKDKDGNHIFPFLNKKEPKDGAGQPEIDQINNHNKMVDLMNDKVKEANKMMGSPEGRTEVSVAAAAAHYLNAQLKSLMLKNKNLEEKLAKISTVNSETEKVKRNGKTNGDIPSYQIDSDSAIGEFFGRR